MIDIENDVFTTISEALRERYSDIFVAGEYNPVPAKFPAVTLVEADNRILERMRTLNIENAVSVMYEVNIYTDKPSGKKMQAKQIADVVDEEFAKIGFTRTFRNQVPNFNNATIYRIVCRYEATVDKDLWIYQN